MNTLDSGPIASVRAGNLREVFLVAFPLIVSSSTQAVKLFSDRLMMAWYSDVSIAAALGAGTAAFMLVSFFMGLASYANAFVAQYHGAERHSHTGLSVWQAILFSIAAGVFLAALGYTLRNMFYWFGHSAELAGQERSYFMILMGGGVFALLNSAIMCFWTGRNKTWTVVGVSFFTIFLNIAFNWALIFGAEGSRHLSIYPWPLHSIGGALNWLARTIDSARLGVSGAGLATIGTDAVGFLIFFVLFLRKGSRVEYGTWPSRIFDSSLMWRMIRFGFGNGMQMILDIGAFAVFNIIMGMYPLTAFGGNIGAASGIAISVNGVAFVPMLGVGAAASIMVAHGIGSENIPFAERAVKNARILVTLYMVCMCLLFEVFPHFLVSIFTPEGHMNPETARMAVHFVRFAGCFCIADGFFILYGNAIRGAGDTKFSMWMMAIMAWAFFAIPCMIAFALGASPYVLWSIIVFYAVISGAVFSLRYRQGKWKKMRVIEDSGRFPARRPASIRILPVDIADANVVVTEESEDEIGENASDKKRSN
ncbi:MAG: MATE family efflux transporter [Planctomycetota bacterium]|jgi:MATE family multidrug resistance protein|nr:MATE family efflux transporter [Planctomycetota bacterium]